MRAAMRSKHGRIFNDEVVTDLLFYLKVKIFENGQHLATLCGRIYYIHVHAMAPFD